jgi:hypothetical protein
MADKITNGMLLEHIQAMRNDLQQQIMGLRNDMEKGFAGVARKFVEIDAKFEDARLHREALQEDLVATMRQVGKHEKKLVRLSK